MIQARRKPPASQSLTRLQLRRSPAEGSDVTASILFAWAAIMPQKRANFLGLRQTFRAANEVLSAECADCSRKQPEARSEASLTVIIRALRIKRFVCGSVVLDDPIVAAPPLQRRYSSSTRRHRIFETGAAERAAR